MRVDAGDLIARRSDRALDLVVGSLAVWTVVFHLARLVGLTRDPAFGLWVVATVALAVALARSTGGWAAGGGHGSAGRISATPVVLGLAGAAVLAFVDVDGLWWPLAWLGLVGVLAVAAYAVRDGGPTPATTVRAACTALRVPLRFRCWCLRGWRPCCPW